MFFDLFVPFPTPQNLVEGSTKRSKGKGKATMPAVQSQPSGIGESYSYWSTITQVERERCTRGIALAGHLGYDVVGCTISSDPSTVVPPNPFYSPTSSGSASASASGSGQGGQGQGVPFPDLDPRYAALPQSPDAGSSGGGGGGGGGARGQGGGRKLVQVTRFHIRLDDHRTHCFASNNANALKQYDILSVAPTSEKALQLACTDLCMPGPNQISIITLPLHERPYFFRLNRKQIRQAQRNGVVLELIYSPALFPNPSLPSDVSRRFRQNFFTNAREVVRITGGGKGVILSSGPGGSGDGFRAPIDLINLASILGMPANLAKDAVSLNPKMVLLRAQARRTFKAVFGAPKILPPLSDSGGQAEHASQAPTKGVEEDTSTTNADGLSGVGLGKRPLPLEPNGDTDTGKKTQAQAPRHTMPKKTKV